MNSAILLLLALCVFNMACIRRELRRSHALLEKQLHRLPSRRQNIASDGKGEINFADFIDAITDPENDVAINVVLHKKDSND